MNNGLDNEAIYDTVATGVLSVDTAQQVPASAPGRLFLRAAGANTGTVTLGTGNGVTSLSGITLKAGEQLGPLPVQNANKFWAIGSAAGQKLEWLLLS